MSEKIERKTQVVFAEDSGATQILAPGTTATTKEATRDLDKIFNTAFKNGFVPDMTYEGLAPGAYEFNALLYAVTTQLKYLFQRGIAEYDAGTTYFTGCIVSVVDNADVKTFKSRIDNNINNNPLTSPDAWADWPSGGGGGEGTSSGFIGQIVSGVREDVPEGYLRMDGLSYPVSAYPTFVRDYLVAGKIPTTTQTMYNSTLQSTGACGMFGYDTDGLTFRVPTLPNRIYINQCDVTNNGIVGRIQDPLLPNINGSLCAGAEYPPGSYSGAFTPTETLSGGRQGGNVITAIVVKFSAHNSNAVYTDIDEKDKNKVLTRAVQYPYFVCVANAVVPATEAQYGAFIDGLTSRVMLDGRNATFNYIQEPAYNNICQALAPCPKENALQLSVSAFPWTAPEYGYLMIKCTAGSSQHAKIDVSDTTSGLGTFSENSNAGGTTYTTVQIFKGHVYSLKTTVSVSELFFCYCNFCDPTVIPPDVL